MKIHSLVGSPNCRKVEAAIRHMGAEIEVVYHDLFEGGLKTPEYLSVNPAGRAPALEDGDFRLAESNAILVYLATANQSPLFPADPKTRAQILQWMNFEQAHFNRALGALGFEKILRPALGAGEPNAEIIRIMTEFLDRAAGLLDQHLAGREFLVGDGVTLADYALMSCDIFKDGVGFDWAPYPNVNAYFERMRKDPHWRATQVTDFSKVGRIPEAA